MSEQIIRALEGADDTTAVLFGPGVLPDLPTAFTSAFGDVAAMVVGDARTMTVAGDVVERVLAEAGVEVLPSFVFPGDPELYADYDNCVRLREAIAGVDAVVVAVGAGTLNDLTKRACGELERPYLVVATAASMDGYTAFGSSIAVDGYKQTMTCPAPRVAVADVDVLAAAPAVMTASGYGDLLGKVPAGADWILADALKVEAIDPTVWDLVQAPLQQALSRPADLAAGNREAVGELAEGLLMSGLAMQAYHGSRPASGSEHLFSHLWEMEGHGVDVTPRRLSHGFKVAVGSVSIAALYEVMLADDLTSLDIDAAVAAWPAKDPMVERVLAHHTTPGLREAAVEQTMAKYTDAEGVRARLETLVDVWPTLRERLAEQLVPAGELQTMLRTAGAPAHPSDIGLGWEAFRVTYARAQLIRSRYTVLDLLAEANLLNPFVDRLFAPDGFWGAQEPGID